MTPRRPAAGAVARLRHPQTTVRWRLTLLYGGLFLVCGAALLAITYTLVDHAITNQSYRSIGITGGPAFARPASGSLGPVRAKWARAAVVATVPPPLQKLLKSPSGRRVIFNVQSGQRISDLHQLVIESSIALAIMATISGALGWVVAGRVLEPLRTMTAATRQMSEFNLHERLALQGPPDELRQLADTIDGLLERLEGAFDAQRRFVANASHELRTPLTTVRALLEMVLSDPRATVGTFRMTCRQVLEESAQQEQLMDALLALAQGQRGIDSRESIDLGAVAGEVLAAHEGEVAARGVHIDVSLEPAPIAGDRRLIERLVSNLVENAIRHNNREGTARVTVRAQGDEIDLVVDNTGPRVPAEEVERLLQPFQRLAGDRLGHGDGLGLGLSIVAAIANAHDAPLDIRPGPDGGLKIRARFARDDESGRQAASHPDPRAVGLGFVGT